ncbi:hypothetical protein [Rhodococcus sp. NPDC003348]
MGAVVGFAALALVANPALSSATAAGSVHVFKPSADTIQVDFTGISSPTLSGCSVDVLEEFGRESFHGDVVLTGNPGDGTYTSPPLNPNWNYKVVTSCVDADGEIPLVNTTPEPTLAFSVDYNIGLFTSLFAS